jgi:hypothetical protein
MWVAGKTGTLLAKIGTERPQIFFMEWLAAT